MENSTENLQNTKNRTDMIWSNNPLLGTYPNQTKTGYQRNICPPMFAALFAIAKIYKLKCPSMSG